MAKKDINELIRVIGEFDMDADMQDSDKRKDFVDALKDIIDGFKKPEEETEMKVKELLQTIQAGVAEAGLAEEPKEEAPEGEEEAPEEEAPEGEEEAPEGEEEAPEEAPEEEEEEETEESFTARESFDIKVANKLMM